MKRAPGRVGSLKNRSLKARGDIRMGSKAGKGFTLIEVIMVLVILSISGFIIAPKMTNSLHAWDLQIEARKVAAKVREVRQLSKTGQMNYGIKFSVSGPCYDVGYFSSSFINIEPTVCPKNNAIAVKTGSWFSSNPPRTLYFDSFGSPVEQGDINVDYPGVGSVNVRIRVATGRVMIQ